MSQSSPAKSDCQLLLDALKPELFSLRKMINELSTIESSYKPQLNHLKMISDSMGETSDETEKVTLLLEELELFAQWVTTILEDEQERHVYLEAGMLENCDALHKNITKKMDLLFGL